MGSRKVLVTGGAGFIGSHLVDRLVELGHTVRILDNLDPQVHPGGKKPDYLNPEAEFVAGDVRDRETVRRALQGVEVVFHEAAAVGVGQSQYRIQHYVDVNTRGTATLLDVLANEPNSVEKIVVAASMSSYGEGKARCPECGIVKPTLRPESQMAAGQWEVRCPYCQTPTEPVPTDERTPRQVNSVYSLTKKDQEDLVLLFGRTYGVQAVALRYFNVFGPRQSLSNPYTGVAAIFISRLKNGNRPVVYEDGQQTRDFVSVHDVVQANILAMEVDLPEPVGLNIGYGKPRSILGIARTLAELLNLDIEPEVTGRYRKGDVRHCYADISLARERLGYEPQISFADGMRELIAWAQDAPAEDKFELAARELEAKGLV